MSRTPPAFDKILFCIAILVGLARFISLDQESLWLDEAKGAAFAFSSLSEWWEEIPHHQAPPGHFIILKAMGALGRSEYLLRFPSALAGWVCIFLVWSIAKGLHCPLPGLPALLFAASPLFFNFSQEARCYTLWTVAELAVWSSLIRWKDNPNHRLDALLCGLLLPLPLLIHYHALWFLVGRVPLIFLLLRGTGWNVRSHFLLAASWTALLAFPWLVHQVLSMPPPNPNVITEVGDLSLAFWTRKAGEFFGLDYPVRVLGWILLLGCVYGGVQGVRATFEKRMQVLILLSLLIPPLLILGSTVLSDRYLAVRHLLPLLPVLLILLSYCFLPISRSTLTTVKWTPCVIGLALVVYGFGQISKTFREVDRPPWREISAFLSNWNTPGKRVQLMGDNVSVIVVYRDFFYVPVGDLEVGFPSSGEIERGEIGGLLLSGETEETVSIRRQLNLLDRKPLREWTSSRISKIGLYPADSDLLDLLKESVHEKVGSHP